MLVKVYGNLLQLFIATIEVFENPKGILQYALPTFKCRLQSILSSFRSHIDGLFQALEAEAFVTVQETFLMVQEIRDEQTETLGKPLP